MLDCSEHSLLLNIHTEQCIVHSSYSFNNKNLAALIDLWKKSESEKYPLIPPGSPTTPHSNVYYHHE